MATSNRIRALNRLPFDFDDGLKIGGVDVSSLNQVFGPGGAALVGVTPVGGLNSANVQAALAELDAEKARLDALSAATNTFGSSLVGHDGTTVKAVLDKAYSLADYTALRAYTGTATHVRITSNGISGFFYYDLTDTASADNGGTIIVSGTKRWKRIYAGSVNVQWFGAKGDGLDDTVAVLAAAASGRPVYFPMPSVHYAVNSNITFTSDIQAGVYSVFGGTGTIVLSDTLTAYARPEWFGDSVIKAYAACKRVLLSRKVYYLNSALTVSARESQIIGNGYGSVIVFNADTGGNTAITVTNNFVKLDNFRVFGNGGTVIAQTAIKVNAVIMSEFKIWIQNFSGDAIVAGIDSLNASNLNTFRSNIEYCGGGINIVSGSKNNILECGIERITGTGIKIQSGTSNTIGDCYFESNDTHISVSAKDWGKTVIRGNYLRRWTTAGISLVYLSTGTSIESNFFSTDVGSPSTSIVDLGAINTTFGTGNMYETTPLARGTHVNLQNANAANSLGVWKDIGTLLFTGGSISTSATSETDLAAVTIPGKALGRRSVVRLEASGDTTGATGAHTIKVYFGTAAITALVTTPVVNWSVSVEVIANQNYASQEFLVKVMSGTTVSVIRQTTAIDTSASVVFKITGQAAVASESVTLYHAKAHYDERV